MLANDVHRGWTIEGDGQEVEVGQGRLKGHDEKRKVQGFTETEMDDLPMRRVSDGTDQGCHPPQMSIHLP